MHLRHIYILCFLILVGEFLLSCSSDVPDVTRGTELQFTTAELSRSAVSSTLNYDGSKFAVYGDMKFGGASSSSDNVVIFNGVPVTYAFPKWTYAQPQYWFPNHEHSFVAVHPADPTGTSDFNYHNNSLSFNYTLPENFDDAQDLMVATHRRMYDAETSSSSAPVMLRFSHIMSRINFNVKNDKAADIVKVTKIELVGVNQSGSFAITPAPLLSGSKQTDDYTFSWKDLEEEVTFAADIDVNIPENETRHLFPDDNALFVLPQPDNKDIGLKIGYTLMFNTGGTEEMTTDATAPIGGWEPGKVYTYSITVTPNTKLIEVTVSVTDWKEGPNDDVVVPRK